MPFNQKIRDIHPTDDTWQEATPAVRLAFHDEAGKRAVAIKRGELARGIGANGRRMAPRIRPRPDHANGPVLTPHGEASRTARLLASHPTVESVTVFWRSGHSRAQKLPWGTILGFHADGQVPGAPIRDVRLSKRGIAQLKAEMLRWWDTHHRARLVKARAKRLADEAAKRRRETPRPSRIAAKAVDAMAKRYPSIADYLRPKGGGF